MRYLDMETWPRREHFTLFNSFNHPHFGVCANMDVTALRRYVRQHEYSFTVAVVYLIARAANAVPEFRLRIRDAAVVEHEHVDPSFTILVGHELFGFCTIGYAPDFPAFSREAEGQIAYMQAHPTLINEASRDDVLYMTAFPWVSFTGFIHPMQQHPADSIPRFAFGKVFGAPGRRQMPLNVQGHHALMDGVHVGKFYTLLEGYLAQPELTLGPLGS